MSNINIEAAVRRIMLHGPDRVVIKANGEAVGSERARREHGVNPEVIFIRKDGWSLAAPRNLESIAYQQWAGDWVAFMRKPEPNAQPIDLWRSNE